MLINSFNSFEPSDLLIFSHTELLAGLTLLLVLVILSGWWWAVAVFVDGKRRGIRNHLAWALLVLFTNIWGVTLYMSITRRAESAMALSPLDIASAGRSQSMRKLLAVGLAVLLATVLLINSFQVLRNKEAIISSELSSRRLFEDFVVPGLLMIYLVFDLWRHPRPNPLDSPVWGMTKTSEGYVDDSLTQHPRLARNLFYIVSFIGLIVVLLIAAPLFGIL